MDFDAALAPVLRPVLARPVPDSLAVVHAGLPPRPAPRVLLFAVSDPTRPASPVRSGAGRVLDSLSFHANPLTVKHTLTYVNETFANPLKTSLGPRPCACYICKQPQ